MKKLGLGLMVLAVLGMAAPASAQDRQVLGCEARYNRDVVIVWHVAGVKTVVVNYTTVGNPNSSGDWKIVVAATGTRTRVPLDFPVDHWAGCSCRARFY